MQLKKLKFQSTPFLLLIGFCVLFLRAWPRLLYPEIWVEDGTQTITGFINEGISNFLTPVSGYLVLIPKLISFTALNISFTAYPLISIALTWAFSVFVFWVIAKAPTYLRGQSLLAIACLMIPSDPEVFGLPSYAFWWSSLLLFILVFWKENLNTSGRAILLILASLSAPVCLITLPLLWVRGILYKKPSEWFIAILASVLCAIQVVVMLTYNNTGQLNLSNTFNLFIPVFFGSYLVGNINSHWNWISGFVLISFLLIGTFRNKNWVLGFLIYLLASSILMSAYRVEISILNPINAGLRYFFYPYLLVSWILIQLLFSGQFLTRIVAGIFLVISLLNAFPHLNRKHDNLNWGEDIINCSQSQTYTFPAHFAGDKNNVWTFTLTGEQCKDLIQKDPFRKRD